MNKEKKQTRPYSRAQQASSINDYFTGTTAQSYPRPHTSGIVKPMMGFPGKESVEDGGKALFVARTKKMMQVKEATVANSRNNIVNGNDNYGYGDRGITY